MRHNQLSLRAGVKQYAEWAVYGLAALWVVSLWFVIGSADTKQDLSNFGLSIIPHIAAFAMWSTARMRQGRLRRFWVLLGTSAFSWGVGMGIWTWYETVLGQDVPFPGFSDVGYLLAVPLAAAALLSLPSNPQSAAGRFRTLLDGLIVAGSIFLVSWVAVLGPLYNAGAGGDLLGYGVGLAYPLGDIITITIVFYVILRSRQTGAIPPVPLGLIGGALAAWAIADSGFNYFVLQGTYQSGSLIDAGWFIGYVLLFRAAVLSRRRDPAEPVKVDEEKTLDGVEQSPQGLLLPYVAVVIALITSVLEMIDGTADLFVTWNRTFILALIVLRQVVATRELAAARLRVQERTAELFAIRRRFEALAQHSSDVVAILDASGTVRYVSGSVRRVFGMEPDGVLENAITDWVSPESVDDVNGALEYALAEPYSTRTVEVVMGKGRAQHAEFTLTNLLDNPHVEGLILNSYDITERKMLEDQLVHQAFHDSLTSLANRALFKEQVADALSSADREKATVLFLDLDGFKEVNDSLGHAAGDLLLVHVSDRLRSVIRPQDAVARLGGDEFAVLLRDAVNDEAALRVARRVMEAIGQPFTVGGSAVEVLGSIGVARVSDEVLDSDHLLRNADLAMYRAKADGKGRIRVYDPTMHQHFVDRFQLEGDLRRALEQGEFFLAYQPKFHLGTGLITGTEALIRWQHPERGVISPGEFIPVAEETGLINGIGKWVLEEACRQVAEWQSRFPAHRDMMMSVNISGRQLAQPELAAQVEAAISAAGVDPACIVLEMTESVLIDSTANVALIRELKGLGVRIAIDDFGTGYSSLSYLHRLPVDLLKIDRSFVERVGGPKGTESQLVDTIVKLGHALSLATLAEGIEDETQLNALRTLGCDYGQGFHMCRPMEARAITEFIERFDPEEVEVA